VSLQCFGQAAASPLYGTSDVGYQAKLGRLTDEEIEANEVATATHHEFAVKLFMDGTEAWGGTSEQVECTKELVWKARNKHRWRR
jgi:hypothetical protein